MSNRHADDPRISRVLAEGLYAQGMLASVIAAVIGAAMVGVMWHRADHATLAGWYSLVLANQAMRVWLVRGFRKVADTPFDPAPWLVRYTWTMAAGGAIFGCSAFVMFGSQDLPGQAFLVMMIFGLGAGAMPANAYHRPALVAHLGLILLPMIGRLAYEGGFDHGVLAATTTFGLIVVLAFGLRQSALLRDSVELRFRNVELIGELERRTAVAEAANRAKSQFFAAASHDLRQPLHALGLFAASLRDSLRGSPHGKKVEPILAGVDSLESLFDELLDISKLDAGQIPVDPVHFAVAPLLERQVATLGAEAVRKHRRLRCVRTDAVAHGDPLLVERVVENLLSNAIRYTERGGIVIGCRRRGDRLAIEVWDTGIGIPAGEHGRIFDEFVQLGNPERDRKRGLGLGLATVRRIASLTDCPVTLDSRVGRGSVFRMSLGRGDAAKVAPVPAPPTEADVDALAGRVIVVIEDESLVREGMRELLSRWRCEVVVRASADEAIAELAARALQPDIVIADFRLSAGQTGLGAVARLRQRYGAGLAAVLVSGDTAQETFHAAGQAGLPLLTKPVGAARLRAALVHVVQQAPRQVPTTVTSPNATSR